MMCVQNQPLHEILAAILPAFAAGEIRQPRFACWQFHALDAAGAVVEVSWSGSWLQVAASLAGTPRPLKTSRMKLSILSNLTHLAPFSISIVPPLLGILIDIYEYLKRSTDIY